MRPYLGIFSIQASTMTYWSKWQKIFIEREEKWRKDFLPRRSQEEEFWDDEGDQFGPWTSNAMDLEPR